MAIENKILTFGGNKIATVGGNSVMGFAKFTPAVLPDLSFWLNNDPNTMTLDISNKLSQWDDLSGLNNHFTQPTGAKQPIFDTVNNRVEFTRANLTDLRNLSLNKTYTQPNTIVIITSQKTAVGEQSFWGVSASFNGFWAQSLGGVGMNLGSFTSYAKTGGFGLTAFTFELNGTTSRIYEGTTLKLTANLGTGSFGNALYLGSRNNNFYDGYIHEVIAYDRLLTSEEFLKLNNEYIATKYGL